ncbi:MAG: hypothetical protein QW622_03625 [Candidatus Pacearchaeota archaeon]
MNSNREQAEKILFIPEGFISLKIKGFIDAIDLFVINLKDLFSYGKMETSVEI